MKKFITTDKHPFLKEGIEFSYFNTKEIDIPYLSEGFNHITRIPKSNKMVKFWESNGYIKDVEKKEFTNSDMIDFARMFYIDYPNDYFDEKFCKELLIKFMKQ